MRAGGGQCRIGKKREDIKMRRGLEGSQLDRVGEEGRVLLSVLL
jgi:hypothetical protein